MASTNLCIKQTHRNAQDSYFTTGGEGPTGPRGEKGANGTSWYLTEMNYPMTLVQLPLVNASSVGVAVFQYSISSLELQNRGMITFDITVYPLAGSTTISNTAYNQYFLSFRNTAAYAMGREIGGSGPQDVAVLLNSSMSSLETNFKINIPIGALTGSPTIFGELKAFLTTTGGNATQTLRFNMDCLMYLS